MKVYVVTSGEYDSYGICGIFSTYEKAERYIASENDKYWWNYEIEEWEVDDYEIESAKPIYYRYKYDVERECIVGYCGKPTFKYQDSYVEEYGFHDRHYFYYWSREKDLTNKDIDDAYMKWLGENVLN